MTHSKWALEHKKWVWIIALALCLGGGVLFVKKIFTNRYSNQVGDQAMAAFSGETDYEPEQRVQGVLDIAHWTTPNGARVYFVQSEALPIVDVQVVYDAGAARDRDKNGVAHLTNSLLLEGAKDLDAAQIARQLDRIGAEISTHVYRDMASVSLKSLSKAQYLEPAIETLGKILSEPTFEQEAFEREKNNAIISLKNQAQSPSSIASKTFYQSVFAEQPYANWVLGSKDSLQAITPEDLSAFFKQYYVAQNAVIAIVGALTPSQAYALSDQLSQNWPTGARASDLPPVKPIQGTTLKVDYPSSQTHILMGAPGVKRGDPDYFPLMVGNHILGGNGTVTRLFQAIRNDKGLAYDVHSYFIPMRQKGPFIIGLQTKNERAQEALSELKRTVSHFVAKGPSASELEAAKRNIEGGFALRFESNEAICQNLTVLGFYDLGLDYFNRYTENVSKVELNTIQDAFKRRIDLKAMTTVLVGQGG